MLLLLCVIFSILHSTLAIQHQFQVLTAQDCPERLSKAIDNCDSTDLLLVLFSGIIVALLLTCKLIASPMFHASLKMIGAQEDLVALLAIGMVLECAFSFGDYNRLSNKALCEHSLLLSSND